MRINTDTVATLLGVVAGIAGVLAHYNIYPNSAAPIAGIATILLGFITNKKYNP
jgi:hypothetical protein